MIRTGRSELYPEIADELLVEAAQDEEHLTHDARARPRLGHDRPAAGARTGRSARSPSCRRVRGRFDEHDLELAEDLARRAALAIDNSMLFRREHEAAVVLQRSLLPAGLPELEGIEFAARYEPAAPGLEVGGDWYEVVPRDDGSVAVTIGDVAGRGVRAASVMGRVRPALRARRRRRAIRPRRRCGARHADQGVRRGPRWRPSSTSSYDPEAGRRSTCAPGTRRRCCGSPTAPSWTSTGAARRRSGSSTRSSSATARGLDPAGQPAAPLHGRADRAPRRRSRRGLERLESCSHAPRRRRGLPGRDRRGVRHRADPRRRGDARGRDRRAPERHRRGAGQRPNRPTRARIALTPRGGAVR